MANPKYIYGPLATTVFLPRPPRWGRMVGLEERNIIHETNRGVIIPYRLFERPVRQYVFRFPESEFAAFLALHTNVMGQMTAFTWVPDSALPESLLVRKEPGFKPTPLTEPGMDGTVLATWYDYTLTLTGESPGLDILA